MPDLRDRRHLELAETQPAASISSAIASILVTLFQLRAVPVVLNNFSTDDHGNFDLPVPLGK